jgi:hypothetical protein
MGIFSNLGKKFTKGKDGKVYYGKGTQGGLAPSKPNFDSPSSANVPKLPVATPIISEGYQKLVDELEKRVPNPTYTEADAKKFESLARRGYDCVWEECVKCKYTKIVVRDSETSTEFGYMNRYSDCPRCNKKKTAFRDSSRENPKGFAWSGDWTKSPMMAEINRVNEARKETERKRVAAMTPEQRKEEARKIAEANSNVAIGSDGW